MSTWFLILFFTYESHYKYRYNYLNYPRKQNCVRGIVRLQWIVVLFCVFFCCHLLNFKVIYFFLIKILSCYVCVCFQDPEGHRVSEDLPPFSWPLLWWVCAGHIQGRNSAQGDVLWWRYNRSIYQLNGVRGENEIELQSKKPHDCISPDTIFTMTQNKLMKCCSFFEWKPLSNLNH